MSTSNTTISEVPAKLSTLWIFVTLNILSADIIGFIEPGTLERIINDETGFEITPVMIAAFSLFQAIPTAMIVAARWLPRGINRVLNIVAGLLTLVYVLGGGNWQSTSYYVFSALEVIGMLAIVWLAITWRNRDVQAVQ